MAVDDAYVFPGFLTPVPTQLLFQSHRLLFLHASAEVRGGNTLEKKLASTGSRTHNQQVMCSIRSPLSHPVRSFSVGKFSAFKWDKAVRLSRQRSGIDNGRSLARATFFPRMDDSLCDRIYFSPTAVHSFNGGHMRKQPVAGTEFCAEHWQKKKKKIKKMMDK